jgi:hypothetical protein
MDKLQLNVNSLCTRIPEIYIFEEGVFQQQFICEKHTCVPLIMPLSEAIPHTGTAI